MCTCTAGAVAAYYDVPTVSLRNALFPLNMHHPTEGYLWHQTYNEHHPGDAGHKALADLAVHLIQETAVGLLMSPPTRAEASKLPLPLPPPMYPGGAFVVSWYRGVMGDSRSVAQGKAEGADTRLRYVGCSSCRAAMGSLFKT
jgi:hypothetical protein